MNPEEGEIPTSMAAVASCATPSASAMVAMSATRFPMSCELSPDERVTSNSLNALGPLRYSETLAEIAEYCEVILTLSAAWTCNPTTSPSPVNQLASFMFTPLFGLIHFIAR
jgi:hypothetical protein